MAQRIARCGPSNIARKPSPDVFTSRLGTDLAMRYPSHRTLHSRQLHCSRRHFRRARPYPAGRRR
jgi:hypothetical protein